MLLTGETVLVNNHMDDALVKYGSTVVEGTLMAKAAVYTPLKANGVARGLIALSDMEHENAFSESDVRLLETLANSMSVALENARLFDETQRLFKQSEQRAAELAIINSVQQGVAAELDFQAIIDLVGDKIAEIFDTRDISIAMHDRATNLLLMPYFLEHGERFEIDPMPLTRGFTAHVIHTRQPLVINRDMDRWREELGSKVIGDMAHTVREASYIGVPIIKGDEARGVVALYSEEENAYSESAVHLLTTLATTMSVALENARLFDETQRLLKETEQRAAELAVINSIQEGMAAELDFQAIVDLVGDKLREVFGTGDIGIRWWNGETRHVHHLYEYEHGKRLDVPPMPYKPGGTWERLLNTRQPVVANSQEEMQAQNILAIPGTDGSSLSYVTVPILGADKVLGAISMENYEREAAFGPSEVRLLSTVASSMGVALENARLFDETQRLLKETEQRAAELAVINSIQEGIAAELDFQAIIDLVGDKLREVFHTGDIGIRWWDDKAKLIHFLYEYEHGQRMAVPASPLTEGSTWSHMLRDRQPLVLNSREEMADSGINLVPGTDQSLSMAGGTDPGRRPHARRDHSRELRAREGIRRIGSSPAQHRGRQHGRGSRKRAAVRRNPAVVQGKRAARRRAGHHQQRAGGAGRRTEHAGHLRRGRRQDPRDLSPDGSQYPHPRRPDQYPALPVRLRERCTRRGLDRSSPRSALRHTSCAPGKPSSSTRTWKRKRSSTGVSPYPVPRTRNRHFSYRSIAGDQARGLINLVNIEREHAFTQSDVRLLQTLANSMSVALENARLFDETQRLFKESEQRAAELAIINSVQEALAAELNMQGIYDAVGDKIREIFNRADVGIRIHDPLTGLVHFPYSYEGGVRLDLASEPLRPRGFTAHVLRTREELVINENMADAMLLYGATTVAGSTSEKSGVYVPLIAGDQARGLITLVDIDREHAFEPSDVRLLKTLANSMSVALENARLFDETQRLFKESEQRAAELAIINSVQEALAAELNMQGIYDAVGDKMAEVFPHKDLTIRVYDPDTDMLHFPYTRENGQRLSIASEPMRGTGFTAHVLRTREALVISEDMEGAMVKYGSTALAGTSPDKSAIYVPMVAGDQARGAIGLIDFHHENAFSAADVRMLQTLANTMSVALENARLFDETQRLLKETEQRATELGVINSIQEGMAAELDFQAIVDLVGDKLRAVFSTGDIGIRWYDDKANLINYLYEYEHGARLYPPQRPPRPAPPGRGWWKRGCPLSSTRSPKHKRKESASCRER